ncbi:MAG: glycosyltransferase family 39 protein [Candidatus Promineifilaceae bacterium]
MMDFFNAKAQWPHKNAGKGAEGIVKNYRVYLVVILLVAAVLRIYGLNNLSPPGLEHDEVAHWLINQEIEAGHHAIYFTEAYGHESGFHYYQTAFMLLLGDNTLALRLPSVFAGLLGLAVSFALIRRLFGLKIALYSAALLAVLFWPIFYSRLALRAISLPFLSGLSAYFWWRGWQFKDNGRTYGRTYWLYFALGGFFAGLTLHTYMASRAVPIFYVLFTGYLFLTQRPTLRRRWRGIFLFFVIYVLVTLPLVVYLLNNPTAEFRISEVDAPLRALREGSLQPVLENSLKIAGMFGINGDPLWRQNVAGLPVFDPLTALFFYIGAAFALWQWRKPRYFFLILWLSTATIPSIVTVDAPSTIRIINALPVLTVFPILVLHLIHSSKKLSTVFTKLSTPAWGKLISLLVIAVLLLNIGRTTWNLFNIWPNNEEVQFVWQAAFTDMAAYLDNFQESKSAAVGGWTPETMDPPTMALLLHRDDLTLRYFDPTQSLILPAETADGVSTVAWPAILPLASEIEQNLAGWGLTITPHDTFTLIQYDTLSLPPAQFSAEATFGDQITFLGYDLLEPQPLLTPGTHRLLTYWRVERPSGEPRRFFLHLVDQQGQPIVQQDTLGAPAENWQAGDLILQLHTLDIPSTTEPVSLLLGIYNPETNQRMTTGDSDVIRLDIP